MKPETTFVLAAYHKGITIGFGVFFLALGILSFQYGKNLEDIAMPLSIVGTLASVFGILIVFLQILVLNSLSQSTKSATEKLKNDIYLFLIASDISKTIKIVQEIQSYNRIRKFELAIMRMQELKHDLMKIKNNEMIKDFVKSETISDFVSALSIDINGIEKCLNSKSISINSSKLNGSLELIGNELIDLDTKLKNKGGNNG